LFNSSSRKSVKFQANNQGMRENMSGRRFDHSKKYILDIAHSLGGILRTPEAYGIKKPEVLAEVERGLMFQCLAYIYAQRIDMLVSGDDGEENFLQHLLGDLEAPWQYCTDCGFVAVADVAGSECEACGAQGGRGKRFAASGTG